MSSPIEIFNSFLSPTGESFLSCKFDIRPKAANRAFDYASRLFYQFRKSAMRAELSFFDIQDFSLMPRFQLTRFAFCFCPFSFDFGHTIVIYVLSMYERDNKIGDFHNIREERG